KPPRGYQGGGQRHLGGKGWLAGAARDDGLLGAEQKVLVVDVPLLDLGDLRLLAAGEQPAVDRELLFRLGLDEDPRVVRPAVDAAPDVLLDVDRSDAVVPEELVPLHD